MSLQINWWHKVDLSGSEDLTGLGDTKVTPVLHDSACGTTSPPLISLGLLKQPLNPGLLEIK